MKRLVFVGALLVASAALAVGINFNLTATSYVFTNCSASGSTAQTLVKGKYLVTVTQEDVSLCVAATGSTCASGGSALPMGLAYIHDFGVSTSVSCRSTGATGDLRFQRVYLVP